MPQDIASIESSYKLFVEQVVASKLVWGLQNKKGWANSHADVNEDITIVPFWSERALAKASAKDDWRDYTATEIPLNEFLESWCIGMADDDILAGINWDAEMFGKEAGGLDLALDILNRLKEIQSAIKFTKFDSLDEFIADVSASLD
ncbi:DUF2750 domain-containing protein [Mucilaginibacter sp. dw_454]|uniref:DUF2750 domain-containing protein n=1 Tax=Mucilaginibacter sp. dw_454 TaxID=2720079 RepID=UPI001BD5895E|nr:DUF2750 domain-containing protein [Mucilaginibacter sp. dw_454]